MHSNQNFNPYQIPEHDECISCFFFNLLTQANESEFSGPSLILFSIYFNFDKSNNECSKN